MVDMGIQGKKKKIILMGASVETTNMGVGSLAVGMIKSVVHQYPDAEILLLDYGRESKTYEVKMQDQKLHVRLLNIRFSKKLYLWNNIAMLILLALLSRLIPAKKWRSRWLSKNAVLKELTEADFVTSIAGGDSFSDIYGIGRFLYVSLPQLLVIWMGKPLIQLPQTLGPFHSGMVKYLAGYIMRKSSAVYSRDHESLNEIREQFKDGRIDEKLRFCYDVGFIIDPIRPAEVSIEGYTGNDGTLGDLVGINVSGLLYEGGYDHGNMFGLKMDYRQLIHEIIEYMIMQKKTRVLLVPHVFGVQESDSAVCEELHRLLKERYGADILVVHGEYDQNEMRYIIGLCSFFIGSRMHACISALSQCIPTVSIAYSRKFAGVMNTLGTEGLVADPRMMETEAIVHVIDDVYRRRADIRLQLTNVIPQVQHAVLHLFESRKQSGH
jgi:colanic acid/amylovoran biosynthesis protein